MRGSVVVGKVLTYLFLVLAGLVLIYPLLYMTLASFLSQEEYITYIAGTSILPIPVRLYLGTYGELLVGSGPLVTALQVTLRREVWFIASGLLVSLFGGYAFSRLRFPGRDAMFMFFLTALMVPGMLISIPVYVMMARFPFVGGNSASGVGGHGFLNSWAALFILGNVPAFLVFLTKQNMDMIPIEYEEAAIMDGAGLLTILFRVYVPMLKPVMAVMIVQKFIGVWNEYFMPMILVAGKPKLAPIAVALQRLIWNTAMRTEEATLPRFDLVFAGATFMSIPPILLYVFMQRQFVQGLVGVGVRG